MEVATKENFPTVSVVVPTRARGQLLRNCVRSLLAQDYPKNRYAILVVEDGTSDGEKIVAEMAGGSAVPLSYVRIPHSGLAAARNFGAERTSGDVIAYIDDDALAVSCWLSRLVEALHTDGAGGAGGRVSPDYPDDTLISVVTTDGQIISSGNSSSLAGIHEVQFVPAIWLRRQPLTAVKDSMGHTQNAAVGAKKQIFASDCVLEAIRFFTSRPPKWLIAPRVGIIHWIASILGEFLE